MATADVEAAVRHFHDAHAPALHAWIRGRTGDPREAEEVVQETLILAWRKYDQFDPDRGSERAWLFGIARNVAAGRHRQGPRHLRAVHDGDVADARAERDLQREVETSYVRDALRTLSEDHRQVVVETYYRGRTVREVAERLRIPEGTVKSRLHHAMRALRRELERQEVLR